MASQAAKKELLEEALHYHPDGGEEEVDREWEEFSRLMANRRNRPHRYNTPCNPFLSVSFRFLARNFRWFTRDEFNFNRSFL